MQLLTPSPPPLLCTDVWSLSRCGSALKAAGKRSCERKETSLPSSCAVLLCSGNFPPALACHQRQARLVPVFSALWVSRDPVALNGFVGPRTPGACGAEAGWAWPRLPIPHSPAVATLPAVSSLPAVQEKVDPGDFQPYFG